MESAPTVHHTLVRMDILKKGSMRPDNPLHVLPNDTQGTIYSGIHLRKLSFFSRSKDFGANPNLAE